MTDPQDKKNALLAIGLSLMVLIGWQYFFAPAHMQRQAETTQRQTEPAQATPGVAGTGLPPNVTTPATAAVLETREQVVRATPRVAIETPRYIGSINLKGGRIDDLALKSYRETIQKDSPNIVVLSPSGSPIRQADHTSVLENQGPYYADFGWVPQGTVKTPTAETVWSRQGAGPLTPNAPLVLEWDNGEGVIFRRTVEVDGAQLFTVTDSVENRGAAAVQLSPYALISRHGTPSVGGWYILHEGLAGVIGNEGLKEYTYKDIEKDGTQTWQNTGGWLGITDKYWATTLIPDQARPYTARFTTGAAGMGRTYQTDLLFQAQTVAPGASAKIVNRLFSGAKEVALIDGYETALGIDRFDRLIDWGYFYFITKPLFKLIDWLYHLVGNFGVAILIVTVLIKLVFFPLANKSYDSMSKMKKVQPQMAAIRERFADDKMKQQQAMMELYKTERINPVSGCLPVLIQIPVFFALYKVLFVTIEMRHQPFFGWILDLSAPDPTNLFNLFGLIPWAPPTFLVLGLWPIFMGISMFLQMQLNPAPPDPIQASLFRWMPIVFTYMLASFPAGLVIYWTWNNLLSILQQALIMRRNGVKIELWDNMRDLFRRKPKAAGPQS